MAGLSETKQDELFKGVHSGNISLFDLPEFIYLFNFVQLMEQVEKGYGGGVKDFETGSLKFNRSVDYRQNISVFSGAKTFQEVKDLSMFVFDDVGQKRSFADFKKFALQINEQYNVNWLQAEMDTAFGMAQSADKWLQIEAEKEDLPLLQYVTVGDDRVRPEHAAWDGIIRPVDDKFWDTRMPPNDFRCFDKETEIMTDNGWKLFKDLQPENKVMTIDPVSKYIKWQRPINYIRKEHKGQMINIKGNGFDIMVTSDHNMLIHTDWNYKHNKTAPYKFVNAIDLSKSNRIPRVGRFRGTHPSYIQIGHWKIDSELYVKLMGWYLSEGSTTIRRNGYYQIKISQSKYLDLLYNDICSLPVNVYKAKDYVGFTDDDFGKYLHQFGKSFEKYIPEELKKLNPSYLRLFLDRYIMGDGTIQKGQLLDSGYYYKERKIIFTSSKKMMNDLSEVVLKSGFAFNTKKDNIKGKKVKHRNGEYITNHDLYRINILNAYSFGIGNHKNIVEYDGYVYCVEVPEYNTLFVKRNGKTAWSGNCRCIVKQIESGRVSSLRGKPKNSSKIFNVNPGKVDFIFDPATHPYFKVEKRYRAMLKRNFGFEIPGG